MKRTAYGTGAALAAALALAAVSCAQTDVVGSGAAASFKAAAEASGGRVSYSDAPASWTIRSEAGDAVRFSADFASGPADAEFSFDAAPFLAAGLDPARLPAAGKAAYALEGGRLLIRFDLGDGKLGPKAKESAGAAFQEIVRTRRALVGYHAQLDHYGLALGDGNLFEWAKDLSSNDKDLVWVLNPAPFLAAGMDPAKAEGWVFGKVEVMEGKKKVQVDKLLRPFDLK